MTGCGTWTSPSVRRGTTARSRSSPGSMALLLFLNSFLRMVPRATGTVHTVVSGYMIISWWAGGKGRTETCQHCSKAYIYMYIYTYVYIYRYVYIYICRHDDTYDNRYDSIQSMAAYWQNHMAIMDTKCNCSILALTFKYTF